MQTFFSMKPSGLLFSYLISSVISELMMAGTSNNELKGFDLHVVMTNFEWREISIGVYHNFLFLLFVHV